MSQTVLIARYAAAERHSRLVRRLRWLLPAIVGAAVLAFVGVSLVRSFLNTITLLPVRLDGSTLVMDHPHLSGYDANRRPYTLIADKARQDISAPNKIHLEQLDARIELAGGNEVRISSDKGFFDGDANRFLAEGNVHVATSFGYELFMRKATVFTKSSSMESDEPVEVRNGDNRIFADRMQVIGGGEKITFDGKVRTIFFPPPETQ